VTFEHVVFALFTLIFSVLGVFYMFLLNRIDSILKEHKRFYDSIHELNVAINELNRRLGQQELLMSNLKTFLELILSNVAMNAHSKKMLDEMLERL
jgi:hypothetical protein